MQKDCVNNSINGEGIYEECSSDRQIVCDNNVEQNQCNNSSKNVNHNSPSRGGSESSEERFDAILDALDRQIETLNELGRASVRQTEPLASTERLVCCNNSDQFIENSFPKPNIQVGFHASKSYRQSLETYVRSSVSEDGNCSCRFQFASNELKLLNELNECYRKFCQFNSEQLSASNAGSKHQEPEQQTPTQQVTEEASNFIGCEREIDGSGAEHGLDHSCLASARGRKDEAEWPTAAVLQQQRPSNKPRRPNNQRLFIDVQGLPLNSGYEPQKSGASGHHRRRGGQLVRARSDSGILPTTKPNSPQAFCVSRSEGASDDDSLGQTVEAYFGRSSSASIADCDQTDEYCARSDGFEPRQNQSSPEHEERSALVGIEEPSICEPDCPEQSTNKCKRKCWSPRSHPKRHKHLTSTSTSSLDESFCSDYQLGCSLTYESVASPSPRQFSPSDQTVAYCWTSSDEFDSTTASNRTQRSIDHYYPTTKRITRHQVPQQVDGPSKAAADSLFIPAENYHSIESCSSYEIEESGTSLQPKSELPDEQRASDSSRPNRRRYRIRCRSRRRNRRLASNAFSQFEILSSSPSFHSSASSFPETMESDGPQNHDSRQDSAHSFTEAGGLKHPDRADNSSSSTKSNGSPRGTLKRDTIERHTIRGHHDSSVLRLGTNAKTRLQQQGVEIRDEHLRPRGSSESSAGAPIAANMKTVKDIAKVSMPALASLQYLPGQVDLRASRSIDRFSANKNRYKAEQVKRSSSMTQHIDAPNRSSIISVNTLWSRDDESGKHDDSCLFDRLCLCNCLARNHNNFVKKLKNRSLHEDTEGDERISPPLSSESNSPRRWRIRSRDRDKKPSANGPPSGSSNSGHETDLTGKENAPLAMKDVTRDSGLGGSASRLPHEEERRARERDRQSPSSMNLLKLSQQQMQPASEQADAYETKRYVDSRAVAQRKKQSHRGDPRAPATTARINSTALGSIGDLAASGRSSASDSHMSECSPPTDFIKCKPLSRAKVKVASDCARSTDVLRAENGHLEVAAHNQTDSKSQKSCKHPVHESHQAKRVSTYKKFLSPRKLFSSSSSSVCDCCENQQQEHHQPSFLSRSLSRLSGRRRRTSSSGHRDQSTEGAWPRSPSFTSPTVSISNNETDTYSDSINSLDEINLTHSLPFSVNEEVLGRDYYSKNSTCVERVPDIVLSLVEYKDVAGASSSRSMTRSPSNHQHHRPSSAQSLRNHDHTFNSYQRHRHASDLSFNTCDVNGPVHQPRGPFSLPSSPSSRRRNRNRSPRLSQSPVPFQSPANESTKIEDGLNVCSAEHFEKHIGNIKDNQIDTQKRLFTAWINHFAPNLIRHDLILELQDGIKLIGLLATLTHDKQLLSQYERLNRDKQSYVHRLVLTPSSRLKHLSNVSIAIDYLRKNQGMKLVNLNPMDIVSGKANVILGLCWSIILNFQFDKDFLRGSDSSSNHSSITCQSTSRLSTSHTNEDRARPHNKRVEEFSAKDITNARNRILEHINKRFNLKLANLTSSLIDGDVLLAIIRQLLPGGAQISSEGEVYKSKEWTALSDDEKLDYSFELANDFLNVPKLISAADLRQQTIGENNPKPLLIYLSMLLKANPRNCSTDQMLELRQLEEIIKKVPEDQQSTQAESLEPEKDDINSTLTRRLGDIDTTDMFYVEKLQTTLEGIKEIDNILEVENGERLSQIDQSLINRHSLLKKQVEQVESLIDWINKAGQLFETVPRSSKDLARTIEEYQRFFSRKHLPKLDTTLCPTLERQYRECLATSKQRVMSMEQMMKNWKNYDQASQELKRWLATAETKLSEALRPCSNHDSAAMPQQSANPVDLHMSRLDDLVDYFELESVDIDDLDSYINCFSPTPDGLSSSSLNLDPSNRSLSGSLISLGSTGSRISTLTSSKKASYHLLFDDFELKCLLLGAMLDVETREQLLMSAKELKSKLKYITEYKVPQVISEIRMSINRCEMSIQEQDESCSETDDHIGEPEKLSAHGEVTSRDETSPSTDLVSDDADLSSCNPGYPALSQELRDGSDLKTPPIRQRKNKKRDNSKPQGKKVRPGNKNPVVMTSVSPTKGKVSSSEDDNELPYVKRFWNKLVRASKISLSFNIIMLICLAGICVVPLIQRDACCELSQSLIPNGEVTINQRPT